MLRRGIDVNKLSKKTWLPAETPAFLKRVRTTSGPAQFRTYNFIFYFSTQLVSIYYIS